MSKVTFTKMQATGNDFVVIDNSKFRISNPKLPKLAKRLCDRKFGVGANGLLLLQESKKRDFKMRIFNPDGSEPDMCGNGLRCAAVFAKEKGICSSVISVETKAGILEAAVIKNNVKIKMTEPKSIKLGLDIIIDEKVYQVHYIIAGVPHLVFYVDTLENIDVYKLGRKMRYHSLFGRQGANVNFAKAMGRNSLNIRTYERGVEDETCACGTGSVACAIISSIIKAMKSPINIYTKGGLLKVYFKKQGNKFKDIFLVGEAKAVFEGKIII